MEVPEDQEAFPGLKESILERRAPGGLPIPIHLYTFVSTCLHTPTHAYPQPFPPTKNLPVSTTMFAPAMPIVL